MATKVYNGFDLQGQRIQNMGDPSSSSDAATKAYVDGVINGLQWKQPVRVASTANLTVASGVVNGATVDGVTLATGDRILLKNQSSGAENGIYIVAASGAASRALDMDSTAECQAATVLVREGTANGDKSFTQTAEIVTIGTTAQTWIQFGNGTVYTAGNGLNESPAGTFNVTNSDGSITVGADTVSLASQVAGAGLTLNAGVLDVVGDSSITVSANSLGLAAGVAGNGLTLTSGVLDVVAGTGLSAAANSIGIDTSVVARKFSGDYGNGSSTSIAVTHSLGTKDVTVSVRLNSTDEAIITDWVATSTSVVTLTFATAPASNAIRVTVIG